MAAPLPLPGEGLLHGAPGAGAARCPRAPARSPTGAVAGRSPWRPARSGRCCSRRRSCLTPSRVRSGPSPPRSCRPASPPTRAPRSSTGVLRDAATGGAVALAVALVALLASRGHLSGSRPAWLVVDARGCRPAANRRGAQSDGLEELLRAVRRARRATAAAARGPRSTPARSRRARRSTRAASPAGRITRRGPSACCWRR